MAPRLGRNILPPFSGQSILEAGGLVLTVRTSVIESGVVLRNTHIVTNVNLPNATFLHPSGFNVNIRKL